MLSRKIQELRSTIPSNVRLIAVTKGVGVEAIAEAYQAGIRDFAESRLQEALPKQKQLALYPDITWHFIGHLQTNKGKKAIESFTWIHSVDSMKLAQCLNDCAEKISKFPSVCLQVKLVPDPNKYGWSSQELIQDLEILNSLKYLKIKGLMTILPLGLSESESIAVFQNIHRLAQEINNYNYPNLHIDELSMGMSGDYRLAIQAGSTMIRLGRIIFD